MAKYTELDRPWLHLFTSNIRELYIADTLDLLASPIGTHYRFRYEGKYLDSRTRKAWETNVGLIGTPVAIHFSLQHPADFHPAAFIPLRRAEVVRTLVEGNTYVVYFRLGEYMILQDKTEWRSTQRAQQVREYTQRLRALLGQCHPDHAIHATMSPSPLLLIAPSENLGRDFEVQVRYLTPSLTANQRVYFRVTGISTRKNQHIDLDKDGNLSLTAGTDYTLHLAHYQYEPLGQPAQIGVAASEGLRVVSGEEIVIRSRYDLLPIRLFPPSRDNATSGELSIHTVKPSLGPTVRLPFTVTPSRAHNMFGPAVGFGGTCAVALPAVLSSGQNLAWRITFAVLGGVAVALGVWWRRAKGLTG